MRGESRQDAEGVIDASKERELENAWVFVMRNVEHLVRAEQPTADDDTIERIATGLEQDKIALLMECENRDQVSLRIRREVRNRLAAEIPTAEKKLKAA